MTIVGDTFIQSAAHITVTIAQSCDKGSGMESFLLFAKGFPSVIRLKSLVYFRPTTPNPPTTRNPNYWGSRCLILTLGQPMYSNVGAKNKCGITV